MPQPRQPNARRFRPESLQGDVATRIVRPRIDPTQTPFEETEAFKRYREQLDPDPQSPEQLYTKAIIREQGFDGLPHVVSRRRLARYVAQGEVEIYRGVTSAEFAEQFRSGDFFVGRGGQGSGVYAAAGPDALDVARDYAEGAPGGVLRMTIKPGARIGDHAELSRQVRERLEAERQALLNERDREVRAALQRGERAAVARIEAEYHRREGELLAKYDDVGRYAAYLGYDALYDRGVDQYLIFNRTAVRVQKEPIT